MAERELVDPREAFVDELIEVAKEEERIVVVDCDASRTTRNQRFKAAYPERFYDFGIAEQNMHGVAAGLAAAGRIPFTFSFAVFTSMRACEMIRTSICYPKWNVKILGVYSGLSNGKDGATHQAIEDIAIMRSIPNLVVLTPSDATITRKMVRAVTEYKGPVYIRIEYEKSPVFHSDDLEFEIGKGIRLMEGSDVTLVSYGLALVRTMQAAKELKSEGIIAEVIDMPTMKPFDKELLLQSVMKTGALVTLEDHTVIGGLATAACQYLVEAQVMPRFRGLGVPDVFTESGANDEVRDKYGIGTPHVIEAVKEVVAR
jgi:transketolase